MPYGPHTADDRARMLEAIGIASRRRPVRRHPRGAPREPAPPRRARARAPPRRAAPGARRRATGWTSPRSSGAGRVPPLEPADRRPDAAPRRVVHGLHAVPARGQPGHAPEHLRVPVAARRADRDGRRVRLALRRRRRDRRGGADDLSRDAPRAASSSRAASTRTTARRSRPTPTGPGSRPTRSRSSATGRSPARPTSRRWSGCSRTPTRPVAGVVVAQPNILGLLEDMPSVGRLAHAAGALFVSVIEPVSLAVLAPPGEYGADIAAGRGPAAGDPAQVRRPVPRASSPAPTRSSARSPAGWWASRPTSTGGGRS